MSRNFELLSQVGRMHEIVQSPAEEPHAAPPPVEDTFPSTPSLEMGGAVRDEISKLVQNLFLAPQGARRVVFSGTESGCGCSWMCAHAAERLASQGRGSVCVVDCNLRSPGLHQQFGNENHHGLSDALIGSGPVREYAHRLSRNLWLLSCGSTAEAGLTMLGSDRMRSRLTELRSAFDYILIDCRSLERLQRRDRPGWAQRRRGVDAESQLVPPRDRPESRARSSICECAHSGCGSEPAHVSNPGSTLQKAVSETPIGLRNSPGARSRRSRPRLVLIPRPQLKSIGCTSEA